MRTIRKIEIHEGQNVLSLRKGSKILLVRNQNKIPHVWVETDEQVVEIVDIVLMIVGTNSILEEGWVYVDSYMDENQQMWHAYRV